MRYVLDQHELVARFVADMIPHVRERGFGACRAIGIVDDDDELVAGAVFHNLDPEAGLIELSGAALPGRQWLTRATLKLVFQFAFLQCRCQMLVHRTLASNERVLGQLARLNYRFIAVPRLFGRDHDGVLCLLTYEDWVAGKLCQRFFHHVPDIQQKREAA